MFALPLSLSLSFSALDHHLKMKNIYDFDGPWAALRKIQFRFGFIRLIV